MVRWGLRLLTVLVFALGMGVLMPIPAHAAGKVVDTTITSLKIQNLEHQDVDSVFHTSTFYLAMDWDASSHGTDVHAGDYFDVTLPDNMRFPSDTTAREFDLTDTQGNVVAHATVDPGAGDTGGTVHVVFSDAVENRYNVKGTMHLASRFDETKVKMDSSNTFTVTVNGEVSGHSTTAQTGIVVTGSQPITEEHLAKWGVDSTDNPNQATWQARINLSKSPLENGTITDSLDDQNQTYVADSFSLRKVNYSQYGDVTDTLQSWTSDELVADGMLQMAPDGKSFTLSLGDTSDAYFLQYSTTYTPGMTLHNRMTLTGGTRTYTSTASHHLAASGGTGDGEHTGVIRITKVDEDGTTPLAGAVFTVTSPDGSTFDLTTGADGTVTSGALRQGTYTVREKIAPAGYELNDQEYTLTVDGTGAAVQTVVDRPIRTSVTVTKAWDDANDQDGIRPDSVLVQLYANGQPVGDPVTLGADNQWTHTWTDLLQREDGSDIAYTVQEVGTPEGYTATVSGDATTGFTITNAHTPTTPVSPASGRPSDNLPQTSDDSGRIMTIAAIAALAATGCIALAALLRRREQ